MKKYILSLMALTATMSIHAQVVKVYENGTLKETYTNTADKKYKVVFEEAAPAPKPAADPNLLPGEFTVAEGKTVQFTKGNLQATYNGSEYTWGFAANQWDYVGSAAGNTSITSDGKNTDGAVVDLFGWSTSKTNYGINTSTDNGIYSGDFKDWGNNFPGKNYSTLSVDEWKYLLNTRTQTNRYAKAKVNNVKGLLIFPDNYNGTTAVSDIDGIATVNTSNVSYPATSISTETWTTMESAGVVFLPAADARGGINVGTVGSLGYYWSSSVNNMFSSFAMDFNSDYVSPGRGFNLYWGLSVRLVASHTGTPEYVDLGLPSGLLWATCNVGASSPEEYGDYFAWGETTPYYTEGHSQDNPCEKWMTGKTGYNWESYSLCKGSRTTMTKYCTSNTYGSPDGKDVLESSDDAATANMGDTWRMPNRTDWEELNNSDYTDWEWTDTYNGKSVNGYIVYKKKSSGPYDVANDAHIFLPAAGCRGNSDLGSAGSLGLYWSSELTSYNISFDACVFYFKTSEIGTEGNRRYYGQSVRAVRPSSSKK